MPEPILPERRLRVRAAGIPPDGIMPSARRTADLGIGFFSLSTRALREAVDRLLPDTATGDRRNPSAVRQLGRAAVGVALVAERRTMDLAEVVERATQRGVETARMVPVVRDVLVGVDASIARWSERGDLEQARREAVVVDFVGRLVPAVVDALLERIDVGAFIGRLPLADVLDAIDLDTLLDHVDLDAILARLDLNALLERVDVDALLDRIDPNALIDRVDANRLMARVDLDAVLGQVQLGPIVADVLDEVDVGAIVRDSTGSITSDAVDGARLTAMRLDGFIGRVADRALLRGPRDRNRPSVPRPPDVES